MADGVLQGSETQADLEVAARDYVKRVEAFLRKSPARTRAAAPGASGSSESVDALHGITRRLDVILEVLGMAVRFPDVCKSQTSR